MSFSKRDELREVQKNISKRIFYTVRFIFAARQSKSLVLENVSKHVI